MTSKIGLEMRQKILCMNPEGFELVKIKNIASELYQNQHLAQSPVQKLHSLSIFWPNESLCLLYLFRTPVVDTIRPWENVNDSLILNF